MAGAEENFGQFFIAGGVLSLTPLDCRIGPKHFRVFHGRNLNMGKAHA